MTAAPWRRVALTEDGALVLDYCGGVAAPVEAWLPHSAMRAGTDGSGGPAGSPAACIRVARSTAPAGPAPAGPPTLRLGAAAAWLVDDGACSVLHGPSGGADGRMVAGMRGGVTAAGRVGGAAGCGSGPDPCAEIVVRRSDAEAGWELYGMLTIAAALLLSRLHRALVHAAAVVAPDGRAWLLVGDTRAGKTTTAVNLIAAGSDWLSDDQVVLREDAGGILVEGWPRTFHLDEGWAAGAPVGRRREFRPDTLGGGVWRGSARLAGLLFPCVDAGLATRLEPAGAGDALTLVVRQSPWLLADRGAAPAVLGLLHAATALPARRLRLGRDVYRDGARLRACLAPLFEG